MLAQDIRYGLRVLIKGRAFTLVALLTLAIGIGANTAIFSVLDSTVLRPLPYPQPQNLVMVWDSFNSKQSVISAADFLAYRDQHEIFNGQAAAFEPYDYDLLGGGDPERISGYRVSANLFDVLGVKTLMGRTFMPDEEQQGEERVVLLGYGLWQRRFGSDPNILGKLLTINEEQHRVVGVMPPGFAFPPPLPFGNKTFFQTADMWSPLRVKELNSQDHRLFAIARLKTGITPQKATIQLSAIASSPELDHPKNASIAIASLEKQAVEHIRPTLLILLGVCGMVLLISCANIANLLLARTISREKEIALRTAVGAKRSDIFRQLLVESLLLSLTGGIIGSLLSLWGVNLLWTMVPEEVRYFGQAMINLRVLGFVLVTSVVTAFIFGIIPALQLARPQLTETLKEGRAGGTSLNRRRWRSFLIVTEVGLALTLLTGAGLLIRSFNRLTNTNLGFDPQNVLTMKISLPSTRYPEVSEQMVFWNQLLGNIEHLAGVHHAGAIEQLPISGGRLRTKVLVEGYPEPANPAEIPQVEWYTVTPNYFPAMAIPLLRGRLFDTSDGKDSPYVVIISEAMANKYWPGQDPVGKRIRLQKFARKANMDWGSWVSIVGVVSDAKRKAEDAPAPTIYTNLPQNPSPEMTLAIRTVSDPVSIAAAASQEVWRLDQNLVVTQVRPMTEIVSASATQPRFRTSLLTILAIVSLLLAAIGVYGTISYSVSQRTHEMGIRLALGAQQFDIFKLIIGESLKLASLGVIIGAIASYLLSRVLSKFLFGVSATDPVTYLTVSLLIILAVFVASFIPARRAAKLNSMAALLHE